MSSSPSQQEPLSFADVPRGDLDRALDELVAQAQLVLRTQGRLRALLRANQAVVEQLELTAVLRRIVDAAVELVGAQYGALGVISPLGGLEEFLHVGMSDELAERIGHLPEGHGLLGALIDDPSPIRIRHLAEDPRSVGFPRDHPPMDSFLGVPVRVGEEVFGNLYLTNRIGGPFTPEDEQLVASLAATAGFAIENARLFAETERRRAWAAAAADVTAAMLSAEQDDALAILTEHVLELAEADTVAVIVDDGADLRVAASAGAGADLAGARVPRQGSLAAELIADARPALVDDASGRARPLGDGRAIGPVLGVPFHAAGSPDGVLVVARASGRARFARSDLEMATDFAGRASIALELLRAKAAQQSMLLAEDRGRIARDLHDHVIQQLFGSGLELQSIAGSIESTEIARRLVPVVGRLDDAIAQIRTVIFALTPPTRSSRDGIRHRLIELASELASALPAAPSVSFAGPVDLAIAGDLADTVLAVAREALTNAAKHARADHTALSLTVTDDAVVLEIADDGVGIRSDRRSGLANLEERAVRRGGSLTVATGESGTTLTWIVPITEEDQ
ncbi:GAF domain-containing protein [Galbitalea sp. SE-J8]|uniref:sensor histidine kinase n=1 Tax=Galbitalea sp. SE-J8 TaxID=3054952 RepID=UPI00259C97D0|nr:GAF domain-containing protein [Galbitalea sp. SE-J8]MDM4762071.1 GAF domain-containing protein [Galbitalea sp. SE-J8]